MNRFKPVGRKYFNFSHVGAYLHAVTLSTSITKIHRVFLLGLICVVFGPRILQKGCFFLAISTGVKHKAKRNLMKILDGMMGKRIVDA